MPTMKVLILNGSPKDNGNTATALAEMRRIFEDEGIEVDYVRVGHLEVRGCTGCASCFKHGKCVIDDIVNELAEKLMECDGVVIGSPVYYAAANGTLVSLLNRLFYSTTRLDKRMKVGASIAVARRGGCTTTFDQLNRYFTICGMPVASSQYWNMAYGALPQETEQDAEGMQTMRTLARNMVFLMRSIQLGKEKYGLPEKEKSARTNFIR